MIDTKRILISESLLTFVKKINTSSRTYKCDAWQIKMPSQSNYAGYICEVPDYLVSCSQETRNDVRILEKPKKEDFIFYLRKPGTTETRQKLTWDELRKEFEEHSKSLDKSNLPQALVFLYRYEYRTEENRDGYYTVGGIEGAWFWENGIHKRRRSAKNFRFICELSKSNVAMVREKIKRLSEIKQELDELSRIKYKFDDILFSISRTAPSLASATETYATQIAAVQALLDQELQEITTYLESRKS